MEKQSQKQNHSKMVRIELQTNINAPKEIVFDLSRSIDLHKISTQQTNEEAVAGIRTGLISLNETVTWRAKHFGIYQKLTVKITELQSPIFFVDEMQKGAFKSFRHQHHFSNFEEGTQMIDIFEYQAPLGILGTIANKLFLEKYMTNFLQKRNKTIKYFAEFERWKEII